MKCRCNSLQNGCYLLGPMGPTGPAGPPSSTIQVNSTMTGLPGTDASVTNSGDINHVKLDFVIPRGETGPTPLFIVGNVITGSPGSQASVEITPID